MPPDLVQDTWSILTLIVWCSHYSIILHWHWRMKSLKPFQTILHQLLLLQKPFQVSPSNAINAFWIHWSQRVPLNRGVRTYLRLPRRLGRHSFPASRRAKPRLTAVEKKCWNADSLSSKEPLASCVGESPLFQGSQQYDWSIRCRNKVIRGRCRHPWKRKEKRKKALCTLSRCLTWHWTRC